MKLDISVAVNNEIVQIFEIVAESYAWQFMLGIISIAVAVRIIRV